MTAETFFLAPRDNQPSKTYSAEAGRDVASMVDNEVGLWHLTDEFFRAFALP